MVILFWVISKLEVWTWLWLKSADWVWNPVGTWRNEWLGSKLTNICILFVKTLSLLASPRFVVDNVQRVRWICYVRCLTALCLGVDHWVVPTCRLILMTHAVLRVYSEVFKPRCVHVHVVSRATNWHLGWKSQMFCNLLLAQIIDVFITLKFFKSFKT